MSGRLRSFHGLVCLGSDAEFMHTCTYSSVMSGSRYMDDGCCVSVPQVVLQALGYEPGKEELKRLLATVDKDGTGRIDFNGFQTIMAFKMVSVVQHVTPGNFLHHEGLFLSHLHLFAKYLKYKNCRA